MSYFNPFNSKISLKHEFLSNGWDFDAWWQYKGSTESVLSVQYIQKEVLIR